MWVLGTPLPGKHYLEHGAGAAGYAILSSPENKYTLQNHIIKRWHNHALSEIPCYVSIAL